MRVLLCFQLNVRFNWNKYNFKFNYLSRGQLVSLNLDKIFLPLLLLLPCYEAFFGNLIFAIIARMLCGNHLKLSESMLITTRYPNFLHSAILFVLTWWITSLRMILQYYTFSSSTISMICFLKYLTKISEETCAAFYRKKNNTYILCTSCVRGTQLAQISFKCIIHEK